MTESDSLAIRLGKMISLGVAAEDHLSKLEPSTLEELERAIKIEIQREKSLWREEEYILNDEITRLCLDRERLMGSVKKKDVEIVRLKKLVDELRLSLELQL